MTNKERLAALETGQQYLKEKVDSMDLKLDTNFKLVIEKSVSKGEINAHRGLFAVIIGALITLAAKVGL